MKSSLDKVKIETTITYPCLMKFMGNYKKTKGTVVLFTSESEGTVVHITPKSKFKLGFYSETWTSCKDHNLWKPFRGKLTINTEE